MRVRRRDDRVNLYGTTYSGDLHNWNCSNGSVQHTLNGPWLKGRSEVMYDVVVPNFQRRSSSGEIFINPMRSIKVDADVTMGAFAYSIGKITEPCDYSQSFAESPYCLNALGTAIDHLPMDDAPGAAMRKIAGTRAAANIDDATFEGAVFIGELRETIGFLRNPLSSFTKFLSSVRKTKTRSGYIGPTSQFLSDNWLSYRYAVRPLANDIVDGLDAINDVVDGFDPDRRTARGYASYTSKLSDSGDIGSGSSPIVSWTQSTQMDYSVRAGILYEYSRSPDTFGVNLHQLPVTGWELIPFSFVADWFVNIGPWIEAITPKAGVKILGEWTTVRNIRSSVRNSYISDGGTTGSGAYKRSRVFSSNNQTVETLVSTSTNRSPGIEVGLAFNVSPLSGDIGKKRIVDLVALGKQILSS